MYETSDTIAAIATPPGNAARGMVRISGPDSLKIVRATVAPHRQSMFAKQIAELDRPSRIESVVASELGDLDTALWVWPTNRSYTRQPTVEIHTFGSPAVLTSVLSRVVASGARLAQNGEFTLRAFLAGRIDLTAAEAILGVIDAKGAEELQTALRQLSGGLAGPLNQLRNELLELLADIEAGLDFVEDDIEFISLENITNRLENASREMVELQLQLDERSLQTELPTVVLYGRSNAGKSSLFNHLVGREQAIVAATPGTTRDYVSAKVTWESDENASHRPVTLCLVDTAGHLESDRFDGAIDAASWKHADEQIKNATLRLLCIAAPFELTTWEKEQLSFDDPHRLIVFTKADIPSDWHEKWAETFADCHVTKSVSTSIPADEGINDVRQYVGHFIRDAENQRQSASVVPTTLLRCRQNVDAALSALQTALEHLDIPELLSADVRDALNEIGQVVGTVYTDDILDKIFSRFCIGK